MNFIEKTAIFPFKLFVYNYGFFKQESIYVICMSKMKQNRDTLCCHKAKLHKLYYFEIVLNLFWMKFYLKFILLSFQVFAHKQNQLLSNQSFYK